MTPDEAIWVFFSLAVGMGSILSLFAVGFHFFEKRVNRRNERYKEAVQWKRQARQREDWSIGRDL